MRSKMVLDLDKLGLGRNQQLWDADIDELKEQDTNARTMPSSMLDALATTIKEDGRLESFPVGVLREGFIELYSGHHRVRGARTAGRSRVPMIVHIDEMSRSEVVSRQIALNAIEGQDDKDTLGQMYKELKTVEDMMRAYLTLEDIAKMEREARNIKTVTIDLPYKYKVICLVFLSHQASGFEEVLQKLTGDEDIIGVARWETYERFATAVRELQTTEDIRSVDTAVARMAEMVLEVIDARKETESDKAQAAQGESGQASDKRQ